MPYRPRRKNTVAHYLRDNPAVCRERWIASANSSAMRSQLAHVAFLRLNLPEVSHGQGVADLYPALYQATEDMLPEEVAEWSVRLDVMPTLERYRGDITGGYRFELNFPTWRQAGLALGAALWALVLLILFVGWWPQ